MPLQPLAPPQTALEAAQDLFAGTCEITALNGHYHHHFQNCYGVVATALANAEIQAKELAYLKNEYAAIKTNFDAYVGRDSKEEKNAVKGTLSKKGWNDATEHPKELKMAPDEKVRSISN